MDTLLPLGLGIGIGLTVGRIYGGVWPLGRAWWGNLKSLRGPSAPQLETASTEAPRAIDPGSDAETSSSLAS